MLIAVIGENCAGKSTLAGAIRSALGGEIVTGRDYLRLAKSRAEAGGGAARAAAGRGDPRPGQRRPRHDQGAL